MQLPVVRNVCAVFKMSECRRGSTNTIDRFCKDVLFPGNESWQNLWDY